MPRFAYSLDTEHYTGAFRSREGALNAAKRAWREYGRDNRIWTATVLSKRKSTERYEDPTEYGFKYWVDHETIQQHEVSRAKSKSNG